MIRLKDFGLQIPEGIGNAQGYISLRHNTQYRLQLVNWGDADCDAEVMIDGKVVGLWRIPAEAHIILERPVNDHGRFTFYRLGSKEASAAMLFRGEKLGLISVTFKPQINYTSMLQFSRKGLHGGAGGTGLSGRSNQTFERAECINYDEAAFVTIHARLRELVDTPRSLQGISSPIPPAL